MDKRQKAKVVAKRRSRTSGRKRKKAQLARMTQEDGGAELRAQSSGLRAQGKRPKTEDGSPEYKRGLQEGKKESNKKKYLHGRLILK